MFIKCQHVGTFWPKTIDSINDMFNVSTELNLDTIIMGYETNQKRNITHQTINIIVTLAKYSIFKVWCKLRKDKDKFQRVNLYYIFKCDLNSYTQIERYNCGRQADIITRYLSSCV